MGYYASITGADFTIPEANLPAAFEALKALNKRDDLKTAGQHIGDRWTAFSWMDENYDERAESAADILGWLGFEVSGDEGDLEIYGFADKSGDENLFLEAVAKFVRPGSYLEWEGEDGQRWRWEFDGERMTEKSGRTVWE